MSISLSEHFTYKKLLRFVFPSIIMMIFTSIYSVVDGLFVSNFVGKTALAAINLIMPFIMGISALGFMIGTGGSAIVAKTLGEQKEEKAIEYFSLLVYATAIGGLILSLLGIIFTPAIARMLGAHGELLIWSYLFYFHDRFYDAKCFSKLFCDCRQTKTWIVCDHQCRSHKYGS